MNEIAKGLKRFYKNEGVVKEDNKLESVEEKVTEKTEKHEKDKTKSNRFLINIFSLIIIVILIIIILLLLIIIFI